ncbi:MAG: hypothetical protein JO205_01245 [Pseudolabrys sp.]|nr:hypothetical protein [Pseudolabrys sp.]MBV9259973.1 hypothetical protein [Pseudolabrys sp.]
MPTMLPPRKPRAVAKPQKQTLAAFMFNAFMIVSALALTFVVLVTEERYAFGPEYQKTVTAERFVDLEKAP